MTWVNRLTTVSLEMALPPFAGYWLDQQWGTRPWMVAVGGIAGFSLAMWHLLKIAADDARKRSPPSGGEDT